MDFSYGYYCLSYRGEMNFIEVSIFLLFLATISVPIAARSHLPFEIFLVAASAIISLIPGLPRDTNQS